MAQTSFPFSTSSLSTEEQWLRYQRAAGTPDGVLAPDYDVNGTECKVTANGTSSLSVAAGEAMVGGFYYRNDADLAVAVPTNSGGATARKDYVVLRASQSGNTVTAVYVTGGTSFPTLTNDESGNWDLPIAAVTVAAGASVVAPAGVDDARVFVVPGPRMANTTARPATATPGQLLVEAGTLLLGTTSGWSQVYPLATPTWRAPTLGTGYANRGGGYQTARYTKLVTGEVVLEGVVEATQTRNGPLTVFTLPSGYRPSSQHTTMSYGTSGEARVEVTAAGLVISYHQLLDEHWLSLDGIRFFV